MEGWEGGLAQSGIPPRRPCLALPPPRGRPGLICSGLCHTQRLCLLGGPVRQVI